MESYQEPRDIQCFNPRRSIGKILPDSIQALSVVSTHGVIIADLFLLYKHHLLTKQSVHHMIKIKGRKTEDVQGIKQLNAGQNTEILTYKKN